MRKASCPEEAVFLALVFVILLTVPFTLALALVLSAIDKGWYCSAIVVFTLTVSMQLKLAKFVLRKV